MPRPVRDGSHHERSLHDNLDTVETYEGTHDIRLLIVGSDITGINAFN
ncbi:hypothetical protein IID62_09840 [candidate division KSB1 bacterium]|nr:hypothetical protein [candidate division KSB1 bacterium]